MLAWVSLFYHVHLSEGRPIASLQAMGEALQVPLAMLVYESSLACIALFIKHEC